MRAQAFERFKGRRQVGQAKALKSRKTLCQPFCGIGLHGLYLAGFQAADKKEAAPGRRS